MRYYDRMKNNFFRMNSSHPSTRSLSGRVQSGVAGESLISSPGAGLCRVATFSARSDSPVPFVPALGCF